MHLLGEQTDLENLLASRSSSRSDILVLNDDRLVELEEIGRAHV